MADENRVLNPGTVTAVSPTEPTGEEKSSFQNSALEERNVRNTCSPGQESLGDKEGVGGIQTNHIIQNSATSMEATDPRPLVLTGFGPVGCGRPNLSQKIMQEFYDSSAGGFFLPNSQDQSHFQDNSQDHSSGIKILTGTNDMMKDCKNLLPVDTKYHFVNTDPFDSWLRTTDAQLFVHLGTSPDCGGNMILLESSACNGEANDPCWWENDGCERYHGLCEVDGEPSLHTSINIEQIIQRVSPKEGCCSSIKLQSSDKAGDFLCNFLYYRSLYYAQKRKNTKQKVIFIHVPISLDPTLRLSVTDITKVVVQIVQCLLDVEPDPNFLPSTICPKKKKCNMENEIKSNKSCCFIQKHTPSKEGFKQGPVSDIHLENGQSIVNRYQHSAPLSTCSDKEKPQEKDLQQRKHPTHSNHQLANSTEAELHATDIQRECSNPQENGIIKMSSPPGSLSASEAADTTPTIVVTGFGPIYKSQNLSWKAVQKFYNSQKRIGEFEHDGTYRLLAGPPDKTNKDQPMAIETTYDFVASPDFVTWLKSTNARLYVHFGVESSLNKENGIVFENLACNGCDGYWDRDKCNKTWPGPCVSSDGVKYNRYTQFTDEQLTALIKGLPARVKEERINGSFSFQRSSKAGQFLCNFLYYRSLYYTETRASQPDSDFDEKSYVIFVHIPSSLNTMGVMNSTNLSCNIADVKPMSLLIEVILRALLDILAKQ